MDYYTIINSIDECQNKESEFVCFAKEWLLLSPSWNQLRDVWLKEEIPSDVWFPFFGKFDLLVLHEDYGYIPVKVEYTYSDSIYVSKHSFYRLIIFTNACTMIQEVQDETIIFIGLEDLIQTKQEILTKIHCKLFSEDICLFSLIEFVDVMNRLPKSREEYNGKNLGQWLVNQLKSWRKGQNLSLLEEIKKKSFDAYNQLVERIENKAKHKQVDFKCMVDLLIKFHQEEGRLPKQNEKFNDENLGKWLDRRLISWRKDQNLSQLEELKKKSLVVYDLLAERIENKGERKYVDFDYMVELLLKFHQEKGRLPKQNEKFNDENLGLWLNTRLKSWRKDQNLSQLEEIKKKSLVVYDLLDERIENKLEFKQVDFDYMVELLIKFHQEKGRLPKQNEKCNDENLGKWLSRRLTSWRKGQNLDLLHSFQELDPNVYQELLNRVNKTK